MNKVSGKDRLKKFTTGGLTDETPEQKLARYTATYGAKGKKMFQDEAFEAAKKMKPVSIPRKKGPNYEPSDAVKNTKAGLAAFSVGTSGYPAISYLGSVAGSVYDAGTAIRHAAAGDTDEALEDATQAAIGLLPGAKGAIGLKGNKVLSKLQKAYNTVVGTAQAANDVSNIGGAAFATGGVAGDPPVKTTGPVTGTTPKKRLTAAEIKEKYKSNPNLRYTWGDALDKSFPISGGKVKDVVGNAAKQAGIDPALLYTSAMEEGMSLSLNKPDDVSEAYLIAVGEMANEKGKKVPEFDKDAFPIDGFYNYGLDTFGAKAAKLAKKGYLPKDFDKRFTPMKALNEKNELMTSAAFKTDQDALIAKAAMIKDVQDTLEAQAKKKGVKLTPKQKEFFALAGYNAGEGNMDKMITSYQQKGYLKDDKFLDPNFKPASYGAVWNNVQRRLTNKAMLEQEGFLDDWKQPIQPAPTQTQTQPTDMAKRPAGTKFATGGTAGAGGGWGAVAQAVPGIIDLVSTAFNKPQPYSNQPIMNAQTARNMTNPYNNFAMGGELEDIDDAQYQEWLNSFFDNEAEAEMQDDGMNTEGDIIEGQDNEEDDEEDDEETFAYGGKSGIHINPKNKGKFNALKKRTGKTTEQLTHSKNPLTRKRAIFAQNAAKWKHAMGGNAGATDINVEGNEIVETPDGQMQQMQGPSHEQGGIDMTVPKGTKIFSDRLKIEGKSMQQRKANRERTLAKLQKIVEKNPTDMLTKNTASRTQEVMAREEEQDMALMQIANKIYAPPQQTEEAPQQGGFAYGGVAKKSYAWGGLDDPRYPVSTPENPIPYVDPTTGEVADVSPVMSGYAGANIASTSPGATATPGYKSASGMTLGDYVGLGANAFNAIAPIINTRNAARATKPEVNRFTGFGKDAIDANSQAMDFAGTQAAQSKRELDTAAGSANLRNRLGASSINTMRALDTVTDINKNKAAGDINSSYAQQMMQLLGQRGQLTNQRDQVVMSGATARDEREAQNTDNYYSNMAENLVNLGTNVGGIARSLNQSQSNKDNTALLEQMSEYFDFGRDANGKLVLKNKAKATV